MSGYKFTPGDDWFSPHIPEWEERLLPLAGTPCQLLEIGSYEGRSAMWLAEQLLSHPDSRLTCIDSWAIDEAWGRRGQLHFAYNLAECPRRAQIVAITGESGDVLPSLEVGGFDFAYIDGSHEARDVVIDWVLVRRLMRPGGLVCFDDYPWWDESVRLGPQPAIDAILDFWSDKIKVVSKEYQVWVRV